MYKIEGTIKSVGSEQIVSEKFKKREIVLDVQDGKYSQFIKLEFVQGNCAFLDGFASGENVEISFSVKGREWVDRNGQAQYFNTLQGFSIKRAGQNPAPSPQKSQSQSHWSGLRGEMAQDHVDQGLSNLMSDDDDLPF